MLAPETIPVLRCDRRGCEAVVTAGAPWQGADLFTVEGLACLAVNLGWAKDRPDVEAAKWLCPRHAARGTR